MIFLTLFFAKQDSQINFSLNAILGVGEISLLHCHFHPILCESTKWEILPFPNKHPLRVFGTDFFSLKDFLSLLVLALSTLDNCGGVAKTEGILIVCKLNHVPQLSHYFYGRDTHIEINTCNGMKCGQTFLGPNSPNKPSIWSENWTTL
ncbi:hypothetical protein RHSIM_Rhsim06G0100700 [Rhododendron simsii]|uniref:Uncharacterized protein n=1 Tax=Rhododendron simsii TaxID=118357 RepID=A0A834GRM7_RHOSS|nr:hypothetical protein RHSIM_Rhsim06G0100700 [Rhododendron simsii]